MTLGEQRRKALELLAPPPSRHRDRRPQFYPHRRHRDRPRQFIRIAVADRL